MTENEYSVPPESEPRTTRQKLWFGAKILLAVLGVGILVGLAVLRTWPPLLIVQTGSMEPAIEPGDVAIMKRLDGAPQVGDIVSVSPPQETQERLNYPESVLHRIVKIEDGLVYTKGDARDRRDPFTVPVDAVHARMVGDIPGVGQIVAFFTSPLGLLWFAAGVLLLILLPYFELRRDQVELEKAELGSLASLRLELQEVARRVEAEHGGGTRAPPDATLPVAAELDGEAVEVDEDEFDDAAFGPERELDAELEDVTRTMNELVGAVREYGEHLRSHTEVLEGMSAASQDLAATVAALRATLPQLASEPASGTVTMRDESVREQAEAVLARWRLRRATEIAGWMAFVDPDAAARLAELDGVEDDEGIEAALLSVAAERPYLRPR
jgi:signal peptidase I